MFCLQIIIYRHKVQKISEGTPKLEEGHLYSLASNNQL